MLTVLCIAAISFFSAYPQEARQAISEFADKGEMIDSALCRHSDEEKLMAKALVAPEVCLYSYALDFVELRTLYVMYVSAGVSNFSVGPFQMKPSFVEDLEESIKESDALRSEYGDLLSSGSDRERRRFRLERLSSWSGQLRYLDLFISVAKAKTAHFKFPNAESKLRFWATLYNGGVNLSRKEIEALQRLKTFPRVGATKFNYSDVSVEFYAKLKETRNK